MFGEGDSLPGMHGGKWAPRRTGSYDKDCASGREYAEALLDVIAQRQNPALFGTVVRAITAAGLFEGVEVGFCSGIGIVLVGVER